MAGDTKREGGPKHLNVSYKFPSCHKTKRLSSPAPEGRPIFQAGSLQEMCQGLAFIASITWIVVVKSSSPNNFRCNGDAEKNTKDICQAYRFVPMFLIFIAMLTSSHEDACVQGIGDLYADWHFKWQGNSGED